MYKAKSFLSRLVYNKFFWQFFLAIFMLGTAIFFIRAQHVEVLQIRAQLNTAVPVYIAIGILLTILYVVAQGQMYVYSFKALNVPIRLQNAIILFLKRNLISIFLPAGGFSSLVFFTKGIEEEGISKSKIHLSSTLFAFCGILSVVIVAIPVLGIALLSTKLGLVEILSFAFLLLLTVFLFVVIYSISKKGWAYQWLSKLRPSLSTVLDDMIDERISRKHFWLTLFTSIGIEFIGIIHLYICMLALGFHASIPAAIIGYIVMVILLIASPFLRGLGTIEVSLTFILSQFGFPVIAAATITLMFRFFEFWLPLIGGIISFITRKDSIVLRIMPAFIILILGVVNIISSISPAIPARLRLVKNIFPEDLIVTSNAIVLIFGLILVMISIFLLQGSKRAWYVAVSLTLISVLGHLFKAADYEEAILALVAFLSLFYTRANYKLKTHSKLIKVGYPIFLFAILAVFAYGVIGFYFIDKRHFGVEFQFIDSVKAVLKVIFFIDDKALHPLTRFGSHFEQSIYCASGLVILFIVFDLFKPYFFKPYNSEADFADAESLLQQKGISALDYFKTYPDKFIYFNEDRTAFISFKITRHFAMVLEDPVAESVEQKLEMIKKFEARCEENGLIAAYYRVPEESLPFYKSIGKKSIPVGEEAILNLETFTIDGGKMKTTRSAINRLGGEGFIFKVYHGPQKEGLLQKLQTVSDHWLRELNQKEVAFTQGIFDKNILKNQTILTIEDQEEKIYAFLNLVPDYAPGEATYDMIRKETDAPNGILDMLLAKTFLYLKEQGYSSVNMGLAPLSGIDGVDVTQKTIKYAYDHLKIFAQFKGLRRYKEKFYPTWKKKYLIYSHHYHLLQVPRALKRISEGS
ncbi:phosphatidylglycerol lysyltransferase domain-containing protein [Pedobacter sp. MR22-3]|uniref:phosphatidylglycerol lysyltransferase domain-containing protein n=1 Tax=Pedobacter sp. MR22-3 TaxID=2994552 RepID=UPI0022473A05|nr:phosphatidylglycerol lysyltransferase domain-containing protein [Pedobacter sp. MR22-3]MCX2585762.1 phosphatidylglycerol lysyltransferase domain-containing protein [Pedobacter sp. MR22-3]